MSRLTRVLAACALCATVPACWVPVEQGRAMESDIVKLKSELAEQRREIEDGEARAQREREKLKSEQDAALRRIDTKIREVGEALEGLNRAARKTGADLGVELEQVQNEVAKLRGLVEEAQAKSGGLEQGLVTLQRDLDQRLAALESTKKEIDQQKAAQAAAEAEAKRRAAERPATKEAFYDLAKSKVDAGDYPAARQLFGEFLQKWPNDALSANAQYWLGESWYAEKRYREAILDFRKVTDQFPKSEKAPDALLKIAYSFQELGLTDDAKLFLEEVQRSYPKSNAAKIAKERLAEMAKKK